MISAADALAAVGIGLAGAGHCLGMCGGIAAAVNLGGYRGPAATFAYHGGRLLSYGALGALLAALAGAINVTPWTLALRYGAGLLLIAMGLSIGDWWHGIRQLERLGAVLWRPVQRLASVLLPIRHAGQAALLGLLWGLMPCGLIYSALAWAAASRQPGSGALLMLLFGLGTLPAMLGASVGAAGLSTLLRRRGLRRGIAVLLIIAGCWSLHAAYRHGSHLPALGTPALPAEAHDAHGQGHVGAGVPLQAVGQLLIPTLRFENGYRRHFNERCTATLVAPDSEGNSQLLLTAWHCLEYYRDLSRPIVFEHASGNRVEALRRASGGSMRADWALLELVSPLPGAVALAPREIALGTEIVMAGYSRNPGQENAPLSLDRSCRVTAQAGVDLGTDCHARRGASGGPVFSAATPAHYLGIISRGDSAELSIFVPLSRVIPRLGAHLDAAVDQAPAPRRSPRAAVSMP